MVAKASHSVGVIDGILLSLSDVLLLGLGESVALVVISGSGDVDDVCLDLKISLPFSRLKEALACDVRGPQLVRRMNLFCKGIPTTSLRVDPSVILFAVFLHCADCATDILAGAIRLVSCFAS